ncbi:ATP-binding cassette domain-containing protein [Actinomadura decatromicini]|uniref:ATP-binding cassette domain-containing protein n=1 Tax=Actinomadura decatromicini TaxID=2604572 RepID=A0A5D3FU72_9ACTN|nr:ATP-binding cassette domain-containing protein [Actinomadura decatromicini]TYK51416.1 ATP-binding cassette domain-containing protein [Actinomadura decatromicini]
MSSAAAGRIRRAGVRVRLRVFVALVLVVVCAAALGGELEPVLLAIGIWGIAAVGLGLVLGFAGQISLCQATFVGIGAYSYGILTTKLGVPSVAALLCGALVTGALAALVSPILRIRGYYLAIATIVFSLLASALAVSGAGVPGGSSGLSGIPYIEVGGLRLETPREYAALALGLLAAFAVGAHLRYGRGRRWRAIQSIRHDESLADGMGLNVVGIKRELFTVSGAAAGVAGGILGAAFGFIAPSQFSFGESFTLALAVFIGGSLSLWGAVLGVVLLEVSGPLLGDAGSLHGLLIGVAALLTVRLAPHGWIRRREDDAAAPPPPASREPARVTAPVTAIGRRDDGASLTTAGLCRSFGSLHAVRDVDLRIEPGTVVGLIGPNGAGKTTLLDLIAGETRASRGAVQLDGRDVTRLSAYRRARLGLARTYQQSRIITGLSVVENIQLGIDASVAAGADVPRGDRLALAAAAAEQAGAGHLLAKPTGSLTFGERRLVELARLLVGARRLALLDEPFSGLSRSEGEALCQVVRTLRARGTTVVLVEHAIPFVLSLADELVVLDQGRLMAAGKPDQVIRLESVRESYLGSVPEREVS